VTRFLLLHLLLCPDLFPGLIGDWKIVEPLQVLFRNVDGRPKTIVRFLVVNIVLVQQGIALWLLSPY